MQRHFVFLGLVSIVALLGGCGQDKSNGTTRPVSDATAKPASGTPRQETAWKVEDPVATPSSPTAVASAPRVEQPPSSLPMPSVGANIEPRVTASGQTGLKAPPTIIGEPPPGVVKAPRSTKITSAAPPSLGNARGQFPAAAADPPSAAPAPAMIAPASKSGPSPPAGQSPSAVARAGRLGGLTNSAASAVDPNGFSTVKVFYATDRQGMDAAGPGWKSAARRFTWPGVLAGAVVGLLVLRRVGVRARALQALTVVAVMVALSWSIYVGYGLLKEYQAALRSGRHYGGERGTLELGVCEVTIPAQHEVGEVEAPTIWKLEFREDPKKHVVFVGAEPVEGEAYFAQVRERVGHSPRKDAFVFVHGFNVSFDAAAKRTAQIAYDLNFEGAPIFFSWPSQGSALDYAVDKENSEWAASDIREFLVQVSEQSGAEQIHLIAHSMGNRALTYALRGMVVGAGREPAPPVAGDEERPQGNRRRLKRKFNEVVLTAPDIDADIFKTQIAPAVTRVAQRVTLYASSHDKALKLSKEINGHPRAGDSGQGLVVVKGIDTIDVSAVDTSLVGHSYYGSSDTVLTDIWDLIKSAKGPDMREFLQPRDYRNGLKYWVFEPKNPAPATAAQPDDAQRR